AGDVGLPDARGQGVVPARRERARVVRDRLHPADPARFVERRELQPRVAEVEQPPAHALRSMRRRLTSPAWKLRSPPAVRTRSAPSAAGPSARPSWHPSPAWTCTRAPAIASQAA